jgi:hypothetical protein
VAADELGDKERAAGRDDTLSGIWGMGSLDARGICGGKDARGEVLMMSPKKLVFSGVVHTPEGGTGRRLAGGTLES